MSVVRLSGIEIGYTEVGQGSAVVLLHGFPLNRSMWRDQMQELSVAHRVIMPDLRGHGDTVASSAQATMDEMAGDVAALLDYLKIDQIVLGGLSLGGYVAFAFYRLFPNRVRALVLADTRPQADSEEARRNREVMRKHVLQQGIDTIADEMLPKLLAPATLAKDFETVTRVREMIVGTQPEGAAAALGGMAARRDQSDLLSEIASPTLIIVGSEDSVTPLGDAELMHRKIPNSHLEIIEGAGHLSNIERPVEFNRALTDFMNTLEL